MRREDYKQILEQHAVLPGCHLIGQHFITQQDKNPKHLSKLCKRFLLLKETQAVLKNMRWPLKLPDLNPIELLGRDR